MKTNVYYPSAANYLSAAVELNGKYLIMRNVDDKLFQQYGCFFPGCKQNSQYDDVEYLKEQLRLKYHLDVKVVHFIGDVIVEDHDGKFACLYLYKCVPNSKFDIINERVKCHFAYPSEFASIKFDRADGLLAERIAIFSLVYEDRFGKSPRSGEENEKALTFYDSLLYFGEKVAKQDVLDFQALLRTPATFKDIVKAYQWIASRSEINFDDYLAHKQNKEVK